MKMRNLIPYMLVTFAVLAVSPVFASNSLSRAPMQDVVYLAEIASIRHLAQIGEADAQFILGSRYYTGDVAYRLPQSYSNAKYWFTKAARQGHSGAAYNLGVMHLQGSGIQRDLIEALAWFEIAASHGHRLSKDLIPELESLLQPEHIRAAEELKTELVPQVVINSSKNS